MALNFSGTGTKTVYNPNSTIQPFSNIILSDSNQATNPFGIAVVSIEVNDVNGGPPSDANGSFTFTPSDFLKQIAPGVYAVIVPGLNPAARASAILSGLDFTTGSTPTTTTFTVTANDAFNNLASDGNTQVVAAIPPATVIVGDATTGVTYVSLGEAYAGPAAVAQQYIVQNSNPGLTTHNLSITAITPSSFIHTGDGNDAIDVSGVGGINVLDGGGGSNFLVGGKAGMGTDTFFIDARAAASDIWSTVANFHAGDAVTLFGVGATNKALEWVDNKGASGSNGLTLHASQDGKAPVSLTLAGYTTTDLSNGRLSVSFGGGTDAAGYMYIKGMS